MSLSFSIVINTYNRAHTLRSCLESLRYLRHSNFEVIVINGPSTDGTDAILKDFESEIRIGSCPETNLSKSRNVGIAMAMGDIVCFIDDDAVPEPDWLNQLEGGYSDPEVGAVGGFIRDHTGVAFQSKVLVCDRFGDSNSFSTSDAAGVLEMPYSNRFFSLTGTNCSFRRSLLLQIGGFDEEYVYFLDETDVIIRVVDSGYRVRYIPDAEIHHKYAESHLRTNTKVPKSIYFPVRSKAYFCIRNASVSNSLESIYEYLNRYMASLKKDKKWLFEHNHIDEQLYAKLLREIDKGVADGINDALVTSVRHLLQEDRANKEIHHFKRYSTLMLPAQRLRLCILSQDYPPRKCGGIGIETHELATALAAEGHEVTVITRGEGHSTVDFEQGVWVHRVVPIYQPDRTSPKLPNLPQVIKDYCYTVFDEVMRVHARRGLDVVSSPIWDLEGAACIADQSIPTMLELQTTYKLALPSKPEWQTSAEYRRNHVDPIIEGERWALDHASHIVANSKGIISDIQKEYGLVIPNNRISLLPRGLRDVVASKLMDVSGQEDKKIKLLYVGRFEKRKGIDVLLAILPRLLLENPTLEVTLAGENDIPFDSEGPIKTRFMSAHSNSDIASRITFTGLVSTEKLNELYAECDVFVAPSRYESFGLIYLEAMRFSKPCIGTKAGGIPEVITDNLTGLLAIPGDTTDLYEKLSLVIKDKSLRIRLGRGGRKSFLENFTVSICAQKAAAIYRKHLPTVKLRSIEMPFAKSTLNLEGKMKYSKENYLPVFADDLATLRKGRNVRDGYARGWGLQFGDLREKVSNDKLFQEAIAIAKGRTIVTEVNQMNIYLILKFFLETIPFGHIVEFGSYKGGSALFMAYVVDKLYPGMKVYALDTFAGMPKTNPEIDWHRAGDFKDVDLEEIRRFATSQNITNLEFVQGLFQDTAPTLLPKIGKVSLTHIDCDIYTAVAESYQMVKPFMVCGGYYVFDDAIVSSCHGATEAVESKLIREDGLHSEQIFPHFVFRAPFSETI